MEAAEDRAWEIVGVGLMDKDNENGVMVGEEKRGDKMIWKEEGGEEEDMDGVLLVK